MKFNYDEFSYKNVPLVSIRELVLEDQMKIAVDLRNKNFVSLQKRIYSFLRSENSRVLAIYETFSRKSLSFSGNILLINDIVKKLWFIVKKPNTYKSSLVISNSYVKSKKIKSASLIDCSLQFLYKMILDIILEEISDLNNFSSKYFRSPGWAVKAINLILKDKDIRSFPRYLLEIDVGKSSVLNSVLSSWILSNLSVYRLFNFDLNLIPMNILNEWRVKRFDFN